MCPRTQRFEERSARRRKHSFKQAAWITVVVSALYCLCALCLAAPSSSSSSSARFVRRVPMWQRRLQSWVIRQKSQSKIAQRMQSRLVSKKASYKSTAAKGSFLTFERPTKERLFEWFGLEGEDPVQVLRCMLSRTQYNHNKVGITNPLLHITGHQQYHHGQKATLEVNNPCEEERRILLHTSNPVCKTALPVSTVSSSPSLLTQDTPSSSIAKSTSMDQSWWPELQVLPNGVSLGDASTVRRILGRSRQNFPKHKEHRDDWRVFVYRKRVGKGRACYEMVRDAALDWEFEAAGGSMGLMEVPATSSRVSNTIRQQQQENHQGLPQPYRSSSRYTVRLGDIEELGESGSPGSVYRSIGPSSRRLVSYSSKAMVGFFPERFRKKLYFVNPVMCVYDVVDQRAPGSTFTSTAYATLKGHWLSGEERVSVALRDGSQDVDVEILSVSRAGPSLWGKAVWPFVGRMQSAFFQEHLKHLEDTAADTPGDVMANGATSAPIPVNLPFVQNNTDGAILAPPLSTAREGPLQKQPNKDSSIPSSLYSFDSMFGDDEISLSFEGGTIL